MSALSHIKSNAVADFTGTVTVFNSAGSTTTANATDLVRPGDWNSVHNFFNTISGNTLGTSTASGTNLAFGATGGVSVSHSTAAGAATMYISAPATSSLVGASGMSVSTNGSTISIYQGPALLRFLYEPPGASSAGSAMTQGSMSFQRIAIPEPISFTRVDIPIQISMASSATANTGNLLISSGLVLYTANASTLNPIVGAFGTTTYTHASNTANWNSITGPRYASFPVATALSAGEYFVGVQLSTNNNSSIGTATTQLAATISIQHGAIYTASQWAEFGAVTATSVNMRPFVGVAASVTATGQTQQLSNITQTGTALMRANIPVGFRG